MERTREVGAEADSTEGQVPPTDDTAGRTGTGTRQVLVIAGATVVGWIAAVDEKPWWRWVWESARGSGHGPLHGGLAAVPVGGGARRGGGAVAGG